MEHERQNPYNFTRPVTDLDLFAGRQRELEQIEYCLDLSTNRRPILMNLALIGQRASGKTSLLNRVRFMAEQKLFLAVKINLDNSIVSSDINFFFELYNGLMTKGCEKGLFGGLYGETYMTFRKVIDLLDLDVDMARLPLLFPTAYVGSRQSQISNLPVSQHVLVHDFGRLQLEALSNDIPTIVLLFDECDLFSTNETLLQKLRNLFSEVEGYILIFAGTEKMFPTLQEVFSPVPRQFKKISVENFKTLEEVRECIRKPLPPDERGLVSFETIRDLHRLSGGSPYEVQLVCYFMYRRYELGKARRLEISRDVLDDVYIELDRLRDRTRKSIVPTIKQLAEAELRFLSNVLPFQALTIDQSITYQKAKDALSPDPPSDVSGLIDGTEGRNRLQACVDKELIELDAHTGNITFCGDEFDKLYIKYCLKSTYPELEWQWRDESLVELIAESLDDYFAQVFDRLAYYSATLPLGVDTGGDLRQLYDDMLSLEFEEITFQGTQLDAPTVDALTSTTLPPFAYVQEAVLYSDTELRERRVLGVAIGVTQHGERTTRYYFFILLPEVSTTSGITALQSAIADANRRLEAFGIDVGLSKTELISGPVLSSDTLKALAASADKDDTERLRDMVVSAGVSFYEDDDLSEALQTFELATELWPEWGLAYNNAGFVLMEAREDEQAEIYLHKALELGYEYPYIADLDLGYIHFKRGEYDEALDCFQQAQEAVAKVPLHEQDASLRLGYYPEEFSSILDLRDERAYSIKSIFAAYVNLCAVFLALGRTDEALEACRKGLELQPTNHYVQLAKASALFYSGDVNGALNLLEGLIDLSQGQLRSRIGLLVDIVRGTSQATSQ